MITIIVQQLSKSKNDEFYTPMYAIEPILKYIKPNSIIWCPFDEEKSLYVQKFKEEGHNVIYTHINTGTDFFNCEVLECDYIISNPPYSRKGDVFQKLFEIGKPFAMLVGLAGLFESQKRFNMFSCNDFEIMYMNLGISYLNEYSERVPSINPPFSSVYLCNQMLPKQIIFEKINKVRPLK